mgnify:CR=1 FL=1
MKLGNPKNTIEVIQKYDFDFQKKFGQNFLIDERVLEKIISAAEVNKDDFVLDRTRNWNNDTVSCRKCERGHGS